MDRRKKIQCYTVQDHFVHQVNPETVLNLKALIWGWTYREHHCVEVSQGGHSYEHRVVGVVKVMLTVIPEVMKGVSAMGAWG